jgi:hypothetical protein
LQHICSLQVFIYHISSIVSFLLKKSIYICPNRAAKKLLVFLTTSLTDVRKYIILNKKYDTKFGRNG